MWATAAGLAVLVAFGGLAGCVGGGPPDSPNPDVVLPPTAAIAHRPSGEPVPDAPTALGGLFATGFDATEPTLGADARGNLFVTALVKGFDPTVAASMDKGQTWTDVGPRLEAAGQRPGNSTRHPVTSDPYLHVDAATGRVFQLDLGAGCAFLSWSDDQGRTWQSNDAACGNPQVNDHPTLVTSKPRSLATVGYPNLVHICVNQVAYVGCSTSLDGGLTFLPQVPVDTGLDADRTGEATNGGPVCSSLTGHLAAAPDGTLYLPTVDCSIAPSAPVVYVSQDDGLTWQKRVITDDPAEFGPHGYHDVAVAADAAGNLYADWTTAAGFVHLAHSEDQGATWSRPVNVTRPGVTATFLNAIAAGGAGKVAVAYLGSTIPGGYAGKGEGNPGLGGDLYGQPRLPEWDNATWNAYVALIPDALADDPAILSASANDPADPLARGLCGRTRCHGMNDFIGLVLDAEGRPWASFVDACTRECVADPFVHSDHTEGVVATLLEGPALAGSQERLAVLAPPPPRNTTAAANPPDVVGSGYRTWIDGGDITGAGYLTAAGDSPDGVRLSLRQPTSVLLEVIWNDTVQDIDAVLFIGSCLDSGGMQQCLTDIVAEGPSDTRRWNQGGAPGAPDSPSRIEVPPEEMEAPCAPSCQVRPTAYTHAPVAGVEYTTYLTVFDGPIPDGFTAVPTHRLLGAGLLTI